MKAKIIFEIDVTVEVPDDLPEQVRELARTLGENYVPIDASDQHIMERIAIIRGLRGLDHDESMIPELNSQIRILEISPEFPIDFEWIHDD